MTRFAKTSVLSVLALLAIGGCAGTVPPETRTPILAQAVDGTQVYIHDFGGATTGQPIILFHQAGSSARGEFPYIANRLTSEGYRVFGTDLRSGGDLFGSANLTAASAAEADYCDTYPDVVASAERVSNLTGRRPILVGSSYSAALVMKAAVERPDAVAGFASFSPASAAGLEVCAAADLLDKLTVPGLGVRPRKEMEGPPSVREQAEAWEARGVPIVVVEGTSHGASNLVPDRAGPGAEQFWPQFLEFLAIASRETQATTDG